MSNTFPLLLKEGWPDHFLIMIQMLIPAGVVDYLSRSDLFLSVDLKNLRLFLLKMFRFFIPINVSRKHGINHPDREIEYCIYMIINHPDHPSFKRRGNFLCSFSFNTRA